jgi:polyadenylate-binding protein
MKKAQNYRDIYVTEISFDATEEELHQLFSLCGTVKSAQLLTDDNGNSKGAAYIRMGSEKETREAVNMLDGTKIQGRLIKVALSRSKEERLAAAQVEVEQKEKKSRRRRAPKGQRRQRE